ncbi:MAG TPA: sulfite exporter TauE/SafE family protein [Actinomycetota bacterium]|nr:sulfite exporter TauE/SafE family protein [Actinomycetota bacterium]
MRLAAAVAIGFVSGVASGAFGIGGALLSTPGLRVVLDTPALVAVGTTLPVVVPTALTGLVTYLRKQLVDGRSAAYAAASGCVFAVAGAFTTELVEGELLLVLTAALMLLLSLRMIKSPGARQPASAPTPAVLLAIGAASGFLSGLLGIGGGVILVPVLSVFVGLPVKTALGTSLAVVAAQSIPGSVVHAVLGNIDWVLAGALTAGVIPGAKLGSRLAVRSQEATLRVAVGVGMAAMAVVFGAVEMRKLLGQ